MSSRTSRPTRPPPSRAPASPSDPPCARLRRMRFLRGVAFALVATLVGAGCASAPPPMSPTAPVASTIKALGPVREVLPDGLTLLIQDHRSSDIVAVYLWVGTGVRYEKPDGLGYAHFQEHMLFKGTDTFGPGFIDRTVEGQGGREQCLHVVRLHDLPDPRARRRNPEGPRAPRGHGLPLDLRPQGDRRRAPGHLRRVAHRDGHAEVGHHPPALRARLPQPSVRAPRPRHSRRR